MDQRSRAQPRFNLVADSVRILLSLVVIVGGVVIFAFPALLDIQSLKITTFGFRLELGARETGLLIAILGAALRYPQRVMQLLNSTRKYLADIAGVGESGTPTKVEGDPLILRRLDRILTSLEGAKMGVSTALAPERQDAIVEGIRKLVETNIVSASVDMISKTYSDKVSKFFAAEEVQRIGLELTRVLAAEKRVVSVRSFVNLMIGGAIAAYGIHLLTSIISQFPYQQTDKTMILLTSVSKLSVVVLVMVLAHFFLNLYRVGLQEVKYFQNEITNVMAWGASMRAALALGDKEVIAVVTKRLCETERNFVLKKGETTVDLKREARLSNQDITWLKGIREVIAGDGKAK